MKNKHIKNMNVNFILTNNIQKHLSLWMKCRMRSEDNTLVLSHVFKHVTVGSLSNNGGDGNENDKKAIDLDWQNNNFGRSLRSKRFRASSSRTLGQERKKEEWRGRGRGEKVSSSPLPLPLPFFLLPIQLSRYNSTGNACYAGYFGRASPFFCTFLCNRCTTATWNCLISLFGEREHKTTTFFFFSWTSIMKSI